MSDWLHEFPVVVMAVIVFGLTYLVTGVVYRVVLALATGDRARSFKALSPGMLPPLGIIFGLLVGFVGAQVWSEFDRARLTLHREASAVRAVVLLAQALPDEPRARLRSLMHRHVEDAVQHEWPAMATQHATLSVIPAPLNEALTLVLALPDGSTGQQTAQREILTALETALDARRQRIIISQSRVDGVKWAGLLLQALCTLVAIAFVHVDNRGTAGIALALFATGIALSLVLILAHDRPFTGSVAVSPEVLLQVMPESDASSLTR